MVFDKVAQEGGIGAVAGNGFDHVVEVADAAAGGFEGVEELPVAAAIGLVMARKKKKKRKVGGECTWGS